MSIAQSLRADLVFEGGGVKGIGLAGAFRELSDRGYQAECVAGTSAGAITAALVAVGYSGAEVEEIVLHQMHFPDFEDSAFLDHFGKLGGVEEFLIHRGMHSGDYFLGWMRTLLAAKGKTSFGDLRNPPASAGNREYRLQVVVSDLTARSMLVLPRDAAQLGIERPDDLEIAEAIRMSMSIPVFFAPVLGFLNTTGAVLPDLGGAVEFLKAIVSTMLQGRDRFYIDADNFVRTIPIPTLGISTTDFAITPAQSQALFDSGRAATAKFLSAWDFAAYRKRFRS